MITGDFGTVYDYDIRLVVHVLVGMLTGSFILRACINFHVHVRLVVEAYSAGWCSFFQLQF